MNLLVDVVPYNIKIGKTEYKIRTDFRIWIMFEQLLLDESIDDSAKSQLAFNMIFCDEKPCESEETIEEIIKFYRCNKSENKYNRSEKHTSDIQYIYDYDIDDEYIYTAFLQQYNINLQTDNLHWWEFKALFKSLSDSCKIVEIMGYRAIEIESVPKSQRPFYRKMKKIYALPLSADEIQKNNLIEDALLQGKSIKNLL